MDANRFGTRTPDGPTSPEVQLGSVRRHFPAHEGRQISDHPPARERPNVHRVEQPVVEFRLRGNCKSPLADTQIHTDGKGRHLQGDLIELRPAIRRAVVPQHRSHERKGIEGRTADPADAAGFECNHSIETEAAAIDEEPLAIAGHDPADIDGSRNQIESFPPPLEPIVNAEGEGVIVAAAQRPDSENDIGVGPASRRLRLQDSIGHFVDGAVPTRGDDLAEPGLGRAPREFHGVPGVLRRQKLRIRHGPSAGLVDFRFRAPPARDRVVNYDCPLRHAPPCFRSSRPMISIRPLTSDDIPAALRLWQGTLPAQSAGAESELGLGRFLERNPGCCHIAIASLGMLGLAISGHDGRRGYLHHIGVDSAVRRQGIGQRLVEACLAALHSEGIHRVHVQVKLQNVGGLKFWQSLGCRERKDIAVVSLLLKSTDQNESRDDS